MVQTPNCNLLIEDWTISLDGVAPWYYIVSNPYIYIEQCNYNIFGISIFVSYAFAAGG